MHLAEWREWWRTTGEPELQGLLGASWDPYADQDFRGAADARLFELARRLHEGANVVDVRVFLSDLRHMRWPERIGRKWMTRDRRVAEKVVSWYHHSTGESPRD
jgi:hypothetical protein